MHQFVERGLIYSSEGSIGETGHFEFDPDEVLQFYRRSEWRVALRLFANVDEDEETVLAHVSAAMESLIKSSTPLSLRKVIQ
jgi:hypothetical protein